MSLIPIILLSAIALIGFVIFSRFGRKVLEKMQAQETLLTKFMEHTRTDSEAIRQQVFKHQGEIVVIKKDVSEYAHMINELHKRHVGQNH